MPNENNDKGRLVLGHLEAGSSDEHLAYGNHTCADIYLLLYTKVA